MNAITQPASARAELIAEALYEAICDSNSHRDLAHHLAKRGLVIMDAARHDRIQPFDATLAHPDAKTLIARAARIAREGCLVPPGSPTEEERQMCERIAEDIEDLL